MWLLLVSCASPGGVWRLTVEVRPPSAEECLPTLQHNRIGATPLGDDEDAWTETEGETWSERVFFALITPTGDGATLVVGDLILPGAADESDLWTFSREQTSSTNYQRSHDSGYGFEETFEENYTTSLSGLFDGDHFEGVWQDRVHSTWIWSETDRWSSDLAAEIGTTGAIPFGDWLKVPTGDPANTWDATDCQTPTCLLNVTTNCDLSFATHAQRTDLDPEGFDAVNEVGVEEDSGR